MAIKIKPIDDIKSRTALSIYEGSIKELERSGDNIDRNSIYVAYHRYCQSLFDRNGILYNWSGEYLSVKINKKWRKEFEYYMNSHLLFICEFRKTKKNNIFYHIKNRDGTSNKNRESMCGLFNYIPIK